MKKIILILLVFVILLLFAVYRNNSNPKIIIAGLLAGENGIKSGDLKYKIYFLNVLPVATATLVKAKGGDYQGRRVYHLEALAKTLPYLSALFSGSAFLDSYVDAESHNPVIFRQKLQIAGKPDADKEVTYNQKDGVMIIAGVERTILPNTQDPLSAMLNLKKMDLDKIREFEMNINTNQKNYVLNSTVTPKDISVNHKTYKAFVLEAVVRRRDKNNPYHQSKITMIMLKDAENIPISVKVFASGALINAKLVGIE